MAIPKKIKIIISFCEGRTFTFRSWQQGTPSQNLGIVFYPQLRKTFFSVFVSGCSRWIRISSDPADPWMHATDIEKIRRNALDICFPKSKRSWHLLFRKRTLLTSVKKRSNAFDIAMKFFERTLLSLDFFFDNACVSTTTSLRRLVRFVVTAPWSVPFYIYIPSWSVR